MKNYIIEKASGGHYTISVISEDEKRVYLHSKYHPEKDVMELPEIHPADIFVVFGGALGYHLQSFAEKDFRQLIVIDHIDTEKEIRANRELDGLDWKKIFFISGKSIDDVHALLSDNILLDETVNIKTIYHNPSFRAFPAYYTALKPVIEVIIAKKAGNLATIRQFGLRYLINCFKTLGNLTRTARSFTIPQNSLFNTMSALIVSSGPSIDRHIEEIRLLQDTLVIIAVDSAVPVLLANSIKPDLIFSIDPQPHVLEHMFMYETEIRDTPKFVSISSYKTNYPNSIVYLNSHPVAQIFAATNAFMDFDSSTGNVTGDAVLFALDQSFKQVILAGFDSSFSNFSIYSRHTAYQKRYNSYFNNRFKTVETYNMNYIAKSSGFFRTDGLFTRKSFVQYHAAIDRLLQNILTPCFHLGKNILPLQNARSISTLKEINTSSSADKHGLMQRFKESLQEHHFPPIDQLFTETAIMQIIEHSLPSADSATIYRITKKLSGFIK